MHDDERYQGDELSLYIVEIEVNQYKSGYVLVKACNEEDAEDTVFEMSTEELLERAKLDNDDEIEVFVTGVEYTNDWDYEDEYEEMMQPKINTKYSTKDLQSKVTEILARKLNKTNS